MLKSVVGSSAIMLILALAVAAPPAVARAAPASAKPSITNCGSKPGDTNDDWRKCEAGFIQQDKAALAEAEKHVLAAMPKASQADFREEQAAWNAYAAKACRFYFNGDWGSDGPLVQGPVCIDGVIVARTKELRSLAQALTHYEQ